MAADTANPQTLVDKVLERAKRLSGAEVFVGVSTGRAANTRFALNHITTAGQYEDLSVDLSVAYGKRHASVSFDQPDPASIDAALDRVSRLAHIAPEDPEHMPLLGPQKYGQAALEYDAPTADLDATVRADAIKAALAAAEEKGVILAGFLEHSANTRAIGNSAGLRANHKSTHARVTMTARTPDGSGSGWSGLGAVRFADLHLEERAKIAVDKAVASKNPRRLEPGRYTVVLEPAAASEMARGLLDSLNARQIDEGRSAFSKPGGGSKVGEKLLADWITLRSDPGEAAIAAAPFDGEGLPRGRTEWVAGGKLSAVQVARYWAKKTGKTPLAGFSRAELAGGAAASQEELIKGVDRGVLITRFWYIRDLDPRELVLTGLTRDGTFLIEKGEIVGPVNNFRWNESPIVALGNADAATQAAFFAPGEDTDNVRMPALRTHQFNLASISEAV